MEIDKNKFQVFLFVCPGIVPFNFAVHPWFVVNKQGAVSRWEMAHKENVGTTHWGHLHRDLLPPFQGIGVFRLYQGMRWRPKLLGQVEGEAAERVAKFISDSPQTYPFCKRYSLIGPNSNTYARWVLNNFPEFNAQLPWNAFGKNYG